MVPSKTCSCVGEGLFAETDLKINLIYNGPLGYHLGFVCPSFCLRLCRKTQPLQNMRGVWLLSLHLKMSPQVHSNLCKGFPQAFSCTNHPWLSTQCIALHQFNMDTNIPPDVCLLVLPISRHLNVRAKVGWFCHPRRSIDIWVPEPCSIIWSPTCYSFLGLIILDLLGEPEHLFVWAEVTLGSNAASLHGLWGTCAMNVSLHKDYFVLSLSPPKGLVTLILH